ncbi:unnamed protein product [Leptosia nina]|uniref:Uncharacterized protein n=1 Tax=Leptosia nina TaxID=320188 RepID=A0AAV1JPL1_9NEOP
MSVRVGGAASDELRSKEDAVSLSTVCGVDNAGAVARSGGDQQREQPEQQGPPRPPQPLHAPSRDWWLQSIRFN